MADVCQVGGNGFLRPQRALFPLRGIADDAHRIRERFPFEEHFVALRRCADDPERLLRVDGDFVGLSPGEVPGEAVDADLTVHGLAGESQDAVASHGPSQDAAVALGNQVNPFRFGAGPEP